MERSRIQCGRQYGYGYHDDVLYGGYNIFLLLVAEYNRTVFTIRDDYTDFAARRVFNANTNTYTHALAYSHARIRRRIGLQ